MKIIDIYKFVALTSGMMVLSLWMMYNMGWFSPRTSDREFVLKNTHHCLTTSKVVVTLRSMVRDLKVENKMLRVQNNMLQDEIFDFLDVVIDYRKKNMTLIETQVKNLRRVSDIRRRARDAANKALVKPPQGR